jgi:hypothetical protein
MRALVIPIYPAQRAIQQLQQMGRMDLRRNVVRLVVSEVREGRDGMRAARELQLYRLRSTRGGVA